LLINVGVWGATHNSGAVQVDIVLVSTENLMALEVLVVEVLLQGATSRLSLPGGTTARRLGRTWEARMLFGLITSGLTAAAKGATICSTSGAGQGIAEPGLEVCGFM